MKHNNELLNYDINGDVLHAHGGHIIKHGGYYYWIGEDRTGRNKVSCYRSNDLQDWEFRNHILTLDSTSNKHYVRTKYELEIESEVAEIGIGCNIERPKVIYNDKTQKFVMWMHWERPADYREARCAVAVCDTIDGDYVYLGSFNPIGHMSRDCTLFKEENGTAYFISTARDNADIHIYRLSEDYLAIDEHVKTLWPGQYREAPTVFKRNDLYYMLTSGCTGWSPNQSTYAVANAIDGRWSNLRNIGDETTYRSQPTCVMDIDKEKDQYLYIGDRWGGTEGYFESSYVLLPLVFDEEGNMSMAYQEEVVI
ncbi:MAG: family 43 glycosylhydrolase [Cellulosilyticaceae bacterium]